MPPEREPPFRGAVYISSDVIGPTDPTSLRGVTFIGIAERNIYDARILGTITVDAFLFSVQIGDLEIEFQVNPEFGSQEAARREVDAYAVHFGRMPAFLLEQLREVTVNDGDRPFLASHETVIIHTEYDSKPSVSGFVEEILLHELGHVSLDTVYRLNDGWRNAQLSDPTYISVYARVYQDREDIAESITAWFAARIRPNRLSAVQLEEIQTAIPNRLSFFDRQGFDVSPYVVE